MKDGRCWEDALGSVRGLRCQVEELGSHSPVNRELLQVCERGLLREVNRGYSTIKIMVINVI